MAYFANYKSKYIVFKFSITFWLFVTCEAAVKLERNALSESIGYYETLNYPKQYLQEGHSRVRRSVNPQEELELNFHSHSRKFELRLRRETSLFSNGLKYDDHGSFHPANIYKGTLKNDPRSRVHGFVHDGIFEGSVHCGDGNEFHIESSKQYKHLDHDAFHSVIYNVEEVIHPKKHVCGGAVPEHQGWMDKQLNHSSNNDYVHFESGVGNTNMNFRDTVMKPAVHHRQRRAFDEQKKECRLLIRADYTFVAFAGSEERAMYLMTEYVRSVSHIYEGTDFNQDGVAEGITLNIKRITVIPGQGSCEGNDCQFNSPNIGVEKFLDLASLSDNDEYCLAYVFAHRDFADGVLGLAWIGDTSGAGGICDAYQPISGSKKSLNTGIVTNLNYGNTMAKKVVEITLAHEVGHNFGAKHDPLSGECAPGGFTGNFIMYPRATSGTEKNNYDFSSCSKGYVWPVLQAKSSTCFSARNEPICGNRIKEAGEECDCGYENEESCNRDLCCTPSNPKAKTGCKFTPKAMGVAANLRCSESLGLCCDVNTCKPFDTTTKKMCSAQSDCQAASYCESDSYQCPNGTQVPDRTKCKNDTLVCENGECSGSLCSLNGEEQCQCPVEAEFCKICCQKKNQTSTCKVYKDNDKEIMLPSGSPCDNYAGYCDFLSKCRKVDAEGPLSRLKDWLLSEKTFSNILDWMKTYWWACVLIGLGLVLFMAAFIACCSVHTPSSNPNKPPPRHLSLPRTLSRRNRHAANPSAPSASGYQEHPSPKNPSYPPGYDTAMRQPPGYEMR